MLALLSVVSLVAGAFLAGGGAFEWEFLFSDGYREHEWVRSMGRGGARGLLVLLGSVLAVAGFVGQVADAAAKPVSVAANAAGTAELGTPDGPDEPRPGSTVAGSPGKTPTSTKVPAVAGPSVGAADGPPASYLPAAGDRLMNAAAGPQAITIWNPAVEALGDDTLVRIQYRFEPGHQPLANVTYVWIISAASKDTEVPFDSLQNQGRLEHILRVPVGSSGLTQYWSTKLMVEVGEKKSQVSNRLQITSGQVQATPLTTAGR